MMNVGVYGNYEFNNYSDSCLLVWVEALRPSQQFFSHVGTFSLVEPVLNKEDEKDEMSCSRTKHSAPGEIRVCDLANRHSTN